MFEGETLLHVCAAFWAFMVTHKSLVFSLSEVSARNRLTVIRQPKRQVWLTGQGRGFVGVSAGGDCRWLNYVPESVPGKGGGRHG